MVLVPVWFLIDFFFLLLLIWMCTSNSLKYLLHSQLIIFPIKSVCLCARIPYHYPLLKYIYKRIIALCVPSPQSINFWFLRSACQIVQHFVTVALAICKALLQTKKYNSWTKFPWTELTEWLSLTWTKWRKRILDTHLYGTENYVKNYIVL